MTITQFILWGARGHAMVLEEIIRKQGGKVVAMFDTNLVEENFIPGVEVHIGRDAFETWVAKQTDITKICALSAIGGARGRDRQEYLKLFRNHNFKTPTLIHPSAIISDSVTIGENSHLLAGSIILAGVQLGEAVIVNTKASVDHECRLEAGVHVGPGATLCGCVEVGENAFIGAGSVVLPKIRIGKNAIIGAGAVVTRDIPDGITVVGNPAKAIKN